MFDRNTRHLITSSESTTLKNKGFLHEGEYAYVEGDTVIAEHTATHNTRLLGKVTELFAESGVKRVLKG